MKNFLQWCEDRKLEIPMFQETPPGKESTSESNSAARAAIRSHAYPPLYGRGQYPKGYFQPTAADNLVYNKDPG